MAIRRLPSVGATPDAHSQPAPAQPIQLHPQPAAAQTTGAAATHPAPRALAGYAGLPPPPDDVKIPEHTGPKEVRDDAYWEAHPWRPGTYVLDAYVQKLVAWASGGVDVTFRILDWNNETNRSGENHGRPFKFQQSREDLMERYNAPGEVGEKARRGYAYWRRDLVAAYTSAGWPESSWPKNGQHPVPPWWLFWVHTCPDGVVVPVTLSLKIVVKPTRHKWPDLAEMSVVTTEGPNPRPYQAPLPYCVPEQVALEHRWSIAEKKWWGDKAEVCLLDRNALALPHAGLYTYKDL